MTKFKFEKIIIISFIGLIVAFLVGLGGNAVLKAGLPSSAKETAVDYENRLKLLENNLLEGYITRNEYDSISKIIHLQIQSSVASRDEAHNLDKIPDWVGKLGITQPNGMKFDPTFSDYTSVDSPSEGFSSVSLVYDGTYEIAVAEAKKIAESAKLTLSKTLKQRGRPIAKAKTKNNPEISYLNYSLGNTDKDFLVSVQVMPSGRLTIMATNRKQLDERLLAYDHLNNRKNSKAKQKKQ